MPAIAAINMNYMTDATTRLMTAVVLTNSATVGYNRVMSPTGFRLPGVARWVNRTDYSVLVGQPSFELSVRRPVNGSKNYRVTATYSFPTLRTTGGYDVNGYAPAADKAYECSARLEVVLPERSTAAERGSLFDMIVSSLANYIQASDGSPSDATGSPLPGAIVSLDPPYGN